MITTKNLNMINFTYTELSVQLFILLKDVLAEKDFGKGNSKSLQEKKIPNELVIEIIIKNWTI